MSHLAAPVKRVIGRDVHLRPYARCCHQRVSRVLREGNKRGGKFEMKRSRRLPGFLSHLLPVGCGRADANTGRDKPLLRHLSLSSCLSFCSCDWQCAVASLPRYSLHDSRLFLPGEQFDGSRLDAEQQYHAREPCSSLASLYCALARVVSLVSLFHPHVSTTVSLGSIHAVKN